MRSIVLLAILALVGSPPATAQDPDALRQAGAFAVQVAWDDDVDAHRLGIDTAVMRTKTELVLRQSGLPILTVAPGDTVPDALFRVYVSALQLETDAAEPEKLRTFAYVLTAGFVEWLPIRGQSMFAEAWSCMRYGVAEEADFVYGTAAQCTEEFANQWLQVNPRQ